METLIPTMNYAAVVRRNGLPFMREFDPSSTFFPLASGTSAVFLDVDGSVTSASAFVRERWL